VVIRRLVWQGLRVRISPWAWISVCCECCILSSTGLCDGLILRPEESCPVCVCVSLNVNRGNSSPQQLQWIGRGGQTKKERKKEREKDYSRITGKECVIKWPYANYS